LHSHFFAKAPFVYRLGLQVFILARGVRFSYGVQHEFFKTLETQCFRGFLLFRAFLFFAFLPYVLTGFVPLMSPDYFL
jgi:hypothetical protein